LTKTPLIDSVSCFNLGAWSFVWGGLSPPKPPRGDGTEQTVDKVDKAADHTIFPTSFGE